MKALIAGINHFDPLCKDRLSEWVAAQRDSHANLPAFVAVEWDPQLFALVKAQRVKVRGLCESRWPDAVSTFIGALEGAVAFEADTHIPLLPTVPTLWLDAGRELPHPDAIDEYASDRVKLYASLVPKDTHLFNQDTLLEMSCEAWRRADSGINVSTDRDFAFAAMITKDLSISIPEWCIAIVGAHHAKREDSDMAGQLENAHIACTVDILRPDCSAA